MDGPNLGLRAIQLPFYDDEVTSSRRGSEID